MFLVPDASAATVRRQRRINRRTDLLAFLTVFGTGLLICAVGLRMAGFWFPVAFSILLFASLTIFIRPILGVYLTLFFALIGDAPTAGWYPFGLNFSSRQSILYLHDALTISPIEFYLLITTVAWLAQMAGSRTWRIDGRPMLRPMFAFSVFILIGVLWGVVIQGGDTTVAVWELRPVLYIPITFVLVSTLFTRTAHYVHLAIVAVVAISIQNVLALRYYMGLAPGEAGEGLTEHAASIHYDWMILVFVGAFTFRNCTTRLRVLMAVSIVPTLVVFVLSQRRAAVVALAAGVLTYLLVLLFRRTRMFVALFPLILVGTAGYTAAFWNSTSGIGFGARAIKTVIATDELTNRDANSDLYRVIENYDLVYTVRNNPVLGVGFGQRFERPAALPDISFFVFYEYIPHNSILWVWLKTGYFGFVTFLVVIALTLRRGIQAALTVPSGNLLALTVASLGYVVMFMTFASVDIAWDARSTLFFASCLAMCVNIARLSEQETTSSSAEPTIPRVEAPV